MQNTPFRFSVNRKDIIVLTLKQGKTSLSTLSRKSCRLLSGFCQAASSILTRPQTDAFSPSSASLIGVRLGGANRSSLMSYKLRRRCRISRIDKEGTVDVRLKYVNVVMSGLTKVVTMPWLLLDGIPLSFTATQLNQLCAPFGTVVQASIATMGDGTPLGFGRVEMGSREEAEAAQRGLDRRAVLDHIISVSHIPAHEEPHRR